MTPQSTETLLINLQTTIKHLEETIESKNKEIENLKGLIFKLQDIKESKWLDCLMTFPINHQKDIDMRHYNLKVMWYQFGLYMSVGLSTMIIMNVIVSGDSTIQKSDAITRLSMQPSKVIR